MTATTTSSYTTYCHQSRACAKGWYLVEVTPSGQFKTGPFPTQGEADGSEYAERDLDLRICDALEALNGHNDPTSGFGYRLLWDRGLITLDELEAAASEWTI